MPKFDAVVSVHFHFVVEAQSEQEAEALLKEQLGENWAGHMPDPDIDHPRIESVSWDDEVMCLGATKENDEAA